MSDFAEYLQVVREKAPEARAKAIIQSLEFIREVLEYQKRGMAGLDDEPSVNYKRKIAIALGAVEFLEMQQCADIPEE